MTLSTDIGKLARRLRKVATPRDGDVAVMLVVHGEVVARWADELDALAKRAQTQTRRNRR